ncbi:MAG: transporter substrate-binding domain-containing protein [Lachnospiraceae bacterium]|nr:transporter substrate-binding domain-containing protein [Lachnospiraceae bacterium]
MKMKRKALLAAVLALCLAAVSLSACGSNSQGTSGSSSANVKVVKVGVDTVSMPNAYVGEDGKPAGENYEVMKLVDELLPDYEFQFESVAQETVLAGMDAGTYQVGIFNAFRNPTREEKYLFPKYPVSGGIRGLILPANLKDKFSDGTAEEVLTTFATLGLHMVPTAPGQSSLDMFQEFNKNHDVQINYEVAEEVDVSTSIRYIAEGRYDGAQFLKSNYTSVVETVDPDGKTFFQNFSDGGFGTWILYTKNQEALVKAVDEAMKKLYEDGTMAAISVKYYGENVFKYIDGFEFQDVEPNKDYKG